MERCTIELHNADCMEIMARYPDGYFDLAIVDPPYGIGADAKNSTTKKQAANSATHSKSYGTKNWDKNVPNANYFDNIFRLAKNQIIWGANYFCDKRLVGGRIYWDKKVTMPTYSDGEIAYCSAINSVRCFTFTWHGMIQHDMSNKEHRIHPTQKPVELYKWLYANYAKPGMKILDTHLGSGSNAIAAYDMDMALFVGCELDADYYTAAKARIDQHCNQQRLF